MSLSLSRGGGGGGGGGGGTVTAAQIIAAVSGSPADDRAIGYNADTLALHWLAASGVDLSNYATRDLANVLSNLSAAAQRTLRGKIGAGTSDFSGAYVDLSGRPAIPYLRFVRSSETSFASNVVTLTLPDYTATTYLHSLIVVFRVTSTNTAHPNVKINTLANRALRKIDGSAYGAGELPAGSYITAIYNANTSQFITISVRSEELTAAQIKSLYESNSDTNAFTDSESTKLAGIEAGATADQNASEVAVASSGFDGQLASTDDTVQKVAQKVDDLTLSGGGITAEQARNIAAQRYTDNEKTEVGGIEHMRQVEQDLQNRASDLHLVAGVPTWATAQSSEGTISVRQDDSISEPEIRGIVNWSTTATMPAASPNQTHVIFRLPANAAAADYRILDGNGNPSFTAAFGNRLHFAAVPAYDYYVIPITVVAGYAQGKTITLQHHGTSSHTAFDGDVGDGTFDASGLSGNLDSSINTVQELAAAVDGLSVSGGGTASAKLSLIELDEVLHLSYGGDAIAQNEGPNNIFGVDRTGRFRQLPYNRADRTFISWKTGGSANLWLGELGGLDDAYRASMNGSHWLIANTGASTIEITIGGVGSVFPSGSKILPGGVVEIAIFAKPDGETFEDGKAFNLYVTPHDETERGLSHFVTGTPPNTLGNDGDIAYYKTSSQLRLYRKSSGTWSLYQSVSLSSGSDNLFGSDPPSSSAGNIGDTYWASNGKIYDKTGSSTWTERTDFVTQGELEALSFETPKSGLELPLNPKEGQMFFLEQDVISGDGDHSLVFRPTNSSDNAVTGMSKLAGLNLNIDVTGFEFSIGSFGSGAWSGIIITDANKLFVLDDRTNYMRGFDYDYIRRRLTRQSSYDVNLGSGAWRDMDENSDYIALVRTSTNAIVMHNYHTRARLSGGVHAIAYAPVGVAMFIDDLWVINDAANTANYYFIEDDGSLTADTSKNFSLGTGTWRFAFTRSILSGGYYLYVVENDVNWRVWQISGDNKTATRVTERDFSLPSGKSWGNAILDRGKMMFLNDTDDRLEVYDDERIALPPVYASDKIAAIWMPIADGATRRGQWHVAYKTDFPPLRNRRRPVPTEIVTHTDGFEAQRSRLLFVQQRTIGGSTYEIYAESSEDVARRVADLDNYLFFRTSSDYQHVSILFNEGLGFVNDDATFSAAVAYKRGLHNAFKAGEWSRARIGLEPKVALAWNTTREYADYVFDADYSDYDLVYIGAYYSNNDSVVFNFVSIKNLVDNATFLIGSDLGAVHYTWTRSNRTLVRSGTEIERWVYVELR